MDKLLLKPQKSSYAVQPPEDEVIRQQLQGGAGFYRADILGGTSLVDVSFSTDAKGHQYLWAFFRASTGRGSEPFLIDLILETPDFVESTAHFIPGSLRLTSTDGITYNNSCQLEVEATEEDEEFDAAVVLLYEVAGGDPMGYLDLLRQIVETWPEA